jgi:hypothetical protein
MYMHNVYNERISARIDVLRADANYLNGWPHRPHRCFSGWHVSKHRSGSNWIHTWELSRLTPNSRNTWWWCTKLQEVGHNRRPFIQCLILLPSSLNKQAHMNLISETLSTNSGTGQCAYCSGTHHQVQSRRVKISISVKKSFLRLATWTPS